mmetsp:Transcript_14547/g.19122  ORF Transcript_14547/g.19122 Transcript_14547/m.19122 type:complete len:762 (-) Transcript_14547:378-2663(-)
MASHGKRMSGQSKGLRGAQQPTRSEVLRAALQEVHSACDNSFWALCLPEVVAARGDAGGDRRALMRSMGDGPIHHNGRGGQHHSGDGHHHHGHGHGYGGPMDGGMMMGSGDEIPTGMPCDEMMGSGDRGGMMMDSWDMGGWECPPGMPCSEMMGSDSSSNGSSNSDSSSDSGVGKSDSAASVEEEDSETEEVTEATDVEEGIAATTPSWGNFAQSVVKNVLGFGDDSGNRKLPEHNGPILPPGKGPEPIPPPPKPEHRKLPGHSGPILPPGKGPEPIPPPPKPEPEHRDMEGDQTPEAPENLVGSPEAVAPHGPFGPEHLQRLRQKIAGLKMDGDGHPMKEKDGHGGPERLPGPGPHRFNRLKHAEIPEDPEGMEGPGDAMGPHRPFKKSEHSDNHGDQVGILPPMDPYHELPSSEDLDGPQHGHNHHHGGPHHRMMMGHHGPHHHGGMGGHGNYGPHNEDDMMMWGSHGLERDFDSDFDAGANMMSEDAWEDMMWEDASVHPPPPYNPHARTGPEHYAYAPLGFGSAKLDSCMFEHLAMGELDDQCSASIETLQGLYLEALSKETAQQLAMEETECPVGGLLVGLTLILLVVRAISLRSRVRKMRPTFQAVQDNPSLKQAVKEAIEASPEAYKGPDCKSRCLVAMVSVLLSWMVAVGMLVFFLSAGGGKELDSEEDAFWVSFMIAFCAVLVVTLPIKMYLMRRRRAARRAVRAANGTAAGVPIEGVTTQGGYALLPQEGERPHQIHTGVPVNSPPLPTVN